MILRGGRAPENYGLFPLFGTYFFMASLTLVFQFHSLRETFISKHIPFPCLINSLKSSWWGFFRPILEFNLGPSLTLGKLGRGGCQEITQVMPHDLFLGSKTAPMSGFVCPYVYCVCPEKWSNVALHHMLLYFWRNSICSLLSLH